MKLADTDAKNSYKYKWLLSRIYPFIKPFLSRVIIGFLVAIPVGLLDGVVTLAIKIYLDYVIGNKDLIFYGFTIASSLLAVIVPYGVVGFALFQGILRYLNGYLTDWTSQKITNTVKYSLFSNLVYMDTRFFDENSSGVVISRYLSDPDMASRGIVDNIKTITTSFFGALSLIIIMLYCAWKLALIGVVVLCAAFIPVLLIRKRIKSASNKNMVVGGNITTNFNETYSGNRVMAAYCLQERQIFNFNKQLNESFNISMSLVKRVGWMSPLMYFIASIGVAVVLAYGTHLIRQGQMTIGDFSSFIASLLVLYKPVKTLGNTLAGIQTIFVSMGRVFELFDHEPEIKNNSKALVMDGLNNSIVFKDVNFEYVKNTPVLKNLNLEVKKGETLAVVGNSGGGKSTLVNLLPRFYDVTSGSIMFDGVNVKEFSLDSLRKNIAMVFQDNFLFSGTIKENILMGNTDATEDDLFNAVKSAHLEEMLHNLPDGVNTFIGERGTTLSGGQRQRVAIARAMVRKSPIVILDEATSALDNKSEAVVQKALDNLIQNKTVFVIAHRLSTIKNADRIAVINEGNLVELGTHDELIHIPNGHYKNLYEMQFRNQEAVV